MAWTTPATYSVGQVVTAANLNTYIRDNTGVLRANALSGMGELIQSQTISAAASVTFSSLTTSYTHLGFVGYSIYGDTITSLQIRFNADSGANYKYAVKGHTAANADESSGDAAATSITIAAVIGASTTENAIVRGYVYNYRSASVFKRLQIFASGSSGLKLAMGTWESASAITSMTFLFGGNNATGTIAVYGLND